MDQENKELHEYGSPRNPLDLTEELGETKQGQGSNHFQFEDGENPFSYYHEENKRDLNSSEDESNERSSKSIDISPISTEKDSNVLCANDSKYPKVEIGDNIACKPAITLAQSPKAGLKIPPVIVNSPQKLENLKSLK